MKGVGPGRARISEDDVKAHAKGLVSAVVAGTAEHGSSRISPLPGFRPVRGEIERVFRCAEYGARLPNIFREAWTTIPHVTQQDKADITELEQAARKFAPRRRSRLAAR